MKFAAALSKPRFSILHVVTFALTLIVTSSLVNHWAEFKDGVRDGYNSASNASGK